MPANAVAMSCSATSAFLTCPVASTTDSPSASKNALASLPPAAASSSFSFRPDMASVIRSVSRPAFLASSCSAPSCCADSPTALAMLSSSIAASNCARAKSTTASTVNAPARMPATDLAAVLMRSNDDSVAWAARPISWLTCALSAVSRMSRRLRIWLLMLAAPADQVKTLPPCGADLRMVRRRLGVPRVGDEIVRGKRLAAGGAVHVGQCTGDHCGPQIGAIAAPRVDAIERQPLHQLSRRQGLLQLCDGATQRQRQTEQEQAVRPPDQFFSASSTASAAMPLARTAASNSGDTTSNGRAHRAA